MRVHGGGSTVGRSQSKGAAIFHLPGNTKLEPGSFETDRSSLGSWDEEPVWAYSFVKIY